MSASEPPAAAGSTRGIVVLGTGGNCIDIVEIIADINSAAERPVYECIGFLDDDRSKWGTRVSGLPVLGPLESALDHRDHLFVNGIGSPTTYRLKPELIARTGLSRAAFATLVHPTAYLSRSARLGAGTVIFPNVTINSGARVGDHVLVLGNSVLSHDVIIGDFTCVTAGVSLSGGVELADSCYLGTNASVRGGVRVGRGSLVGMGSVVLRDVEPDSVVAGNPARPLHRRRPG